MSKVAILLGITLLGAVIWSGCSGETNPGPIPGVGENALSALDLTPSVRPTSPPIPTFTPGPKIVSANRLLYVRSGRFWVANPDGSGQREFFGNDAPQIYSPPRDPGRAWVSPSGQKLLYLAGANGELWGATISGKENRRLALSILPPEDFSTPKLRQEITRRLVDQNIAWSPKEDQIALLTASTGDYDLIILSWQTGQLVRVTRDEFRENEWAWSPDGTMLVYASVDDRYANQKAHIVASDGKPVIDIPSDKLVAGAGLSANTPIAEYGGLDWLDNRTLMIFPGTARGSIGIWKFDLTTQDLQPLTQMPVARPEWSPQARAWVFARQGEAGRLYILPVDGGEPKVLAEEGAQAPMWSPDGKTIIYSKGTPNTATGWDIHAVNVDGTNDHPVASNVTFIQDEPPDPGPRGKRLLTADGRGLIFNAVGPDFGGPGPNLENWWLASLDGSSIKMLTDLERAFYLKLPSLSPDKQSFAFIGFLYRDKVQHLYTFGRDGGNVTHIDAGVRWFQWIGESR